MKLSRIRPSQLPLQSRLTLWYLLTFGVILLLFATFLYLQLRANLFKQLDDSLQLVASQTAVAADSTGKQLVFPEAASLADIDFIIYLTATDGTVWDKAGRNIQVQPLQPFQPGFSDILIGDDRWQVYSQGVSDAGITGYFQIIGEVDPINDTLDRLLTLMLLGGPLALVLAGLGGFFMAGRALHPIDRMTRTAQTISASDLSQRIEYAGAADEIGRLAQTFDTMLDRLQTAFERERQFTGDAAHELRTPLTALKGQLQVTLSRARSVQAYQTTLHEMEQQVERLIHLSNSLLYITRLEQNKIEQLTETISVDDFFAALLDQIRPLTHDKSIRLQTNIPANLQINGNLDLLIRLFLNLLDNAIKYTPADGIISLVVSQQKQQIISQIINNGEPIPAEHLPHLFERFYRVEAARSRTPNGNEPGGAGLGLAIAQEIAKVHQGHITVESKANIGTTFTVFLPAANT
jgi:heavy metal sensor kinase